MNYTSLLEELRSLGTPQNRKIYIRHGVGGETFGVSFAHLGKLQKRIKQDHAMAQKLWATGNHDARMLATMIADPESLDNATVERWVKDLDSYVITDAFSSLVVRSPLARKKGDKWRKSKQEWISAAGWNITSGIARAGRFTKDEAAKLLQTIEENLHEAKNRVRHSMNQALICIAVGVPTMEKKAVATAKRIGRVIVDHGETSCKTPDAIAYIAKTKAHYAAKKKTAQKPAPKVTKDETPKPAPKVTKKKATKKPATKATKKKTTKKKKTSAK